MYRNGLDMKFFSFYLPVLKESFRKNFFRPFIYIMYNEIIIIDNDSNANETTGYILSTSNHIKNQMKRIAALFRNNAIKK